MKNMQELIADMPKGGKLDVYRKRASFDWKSLKLHWDGEEFILFQVCIEIMYFRHTCTIFVAIFVAE